MLAVALLPVPAKLLEHIRRTGLNNPGDRIGVACSGGADSVALLRLLLELRGELGIVLSVVHFNHQLRGADSDEDERFVAELTHRHDLEFYLGSADTAQYAKDKHLSLEAAARDLRYGFFAELAAAPFDESKPHKIATAHTLDDQAETVLMRIIRGTGVRGLGGIHPRVVVEGNAGEGEGESGHGNDMDAFGDQASGESSQEHAGEGSAEIVRPLLPFRRNDLREYLSTIHQDWHEDSSNADLRFTRNHVRAKLLSDITEQYNPAVAENLAELADIARADEEYWQNEVAGWMGTGIHWTEPHWARPASGSSGDLVQLQPHNPELQRRLDEEGPLVMDASVDLLWLLSEPLAIQRRIVKAVGDFAGFPLEFKHIEEVLAFAERKDATSKQIALPLGWKAERTPDALIFRTPDLRTQERLVVDYAYPFRIPGTFRLSEARVVIQVTEAEVRSNDLSPRHPRDDRSQDEPGYNRDCLFDLARVSGEAILRNWQAGDRYWPAHTKAPKKVKELLQEHRITGDARRRWPVLEQNGELIWVRGFATPAALQPRDEAKKAWSIRAVDYEQREQ
jgi:tRNA(Ile)-lysidine synthase